MPRRARIAVPGIPWHIIQRGNNCSACFYAEEDYHRYIDTLSDMSPRFDCQIHAYVLMTNHVHLLLTPAHKDSASLLMKHLGQRYVQYINRQYRRSGTLWLPHTRNVRLDTASDPGEYPNRSPSRSPGCCLPEGQACRHSPSEFFRGSTPSRSASPVTLAPRLLSCLRIYPPVTSRAARLDTGLVASDYPGGLPNH